MNEAKKKLDEMVAKAKAEKPSVETPTKVKVVVFDENEKRDKQIVEMYPQFNENQIASMLMIPKHIVEQVLKDNE